MFKKIGIGIVVVVIAILAAACGPSLLSETLDDATAVAQEGSDATQLAAGTLQLQDTENAITADQSGELRTLWSAYAYLSDTDTIAEAELEAIVTQIQDAMTTEQLTAIEAMELETTAMPGAGAERSGEEREAPSGDMSGGQREGGQMEGGMEPGAGGDMTQVSSEQLQAAMAARMSDSDAMATQLATRVVEMLDELVAEA